VIEPLPQDQVINSLTLVVARHPDSQVAFEQLSEEQRDPSSPEFHHWLDSEQIGERYGLSPSEVSGLTGWLESNGLHVRWVAPARNFIGFNGTVPNIEQAFHTRLNYYEVDGKRWFSNQSAPMVPASLAPLIIAVRGLSTVEERPASRTHSVQNVHPDWTFTQHFIAPADFVKLYNLPSNLRGTGIAIGIVGFSRVDLNDIHNFRLLTRTGTPNPTVVIPSAYGGTDPGPPYTKPPAPNDPTDNDSLTDYQREATLDVLRSASVAPGATPLLVVTARESGGLWDDVMYLVQTKPTPAQIINISFLTCESSVSSSTIKGWDSLFAQAEEEGISVFVASGDAGTAACDEHGQAPPSNPKPISINGICASSHVTCLGGTEFNDWNGSDYWILSNDPSVASALGHIPEGGWNEPTTTDPSEPTIALASGGGVSKVIPTPRWQMGPGVPPSRAGRYTPDIAFSASGHDGYFACLESDGAYCVEDAEGNIAVAILSGTSAAAPDMAGITALLDQRFGEAQGNLNPSLYSLAANHPSAKAFHDVTIATSGVMDCSLRVPSMCNNSVPSPKELTGGQEGYLVGPGYDEVTGLGSLDVANFIRHFSEATSRPAIATGDAASVQSTSAQLTGTVNPNGVATSWWFEFGRSSSLEGATRTAVSDAGSNSVKAEVLAQVGGMKRGTTYYYRLSAADAYETVSGRINSFTTAE
jgi:subtilase family serine protease